MRTLLLAPVDLGWVTGFLEGEGSFGLMEKRPYGLRYPRISASQKQREPLERLQALLGGRIYLSSRGSSTSPRSPIWTWCLDGRDVAAVMNDLRPHMSPRRQGQITGCIEGEVRRPARGTGNIKAKLNEEAVRAIRASDLSQRRLAALYGVDPATISHVKSRRTWAYVT